MKPKTLRTTEHAKIALFMALALLANLCACYYFNVGVKYFVAGAVMLWACAEFAVRADFAEAGHFTKYYLLLIFPFFLFWAWSLIIWISQLQTMDYVLRGSLNTIYMFTAAGYVVGAYYIFGPKSIYLNFYAMCLANTIKLVDVVLEYGPGRVASEYVTLLTSFATQTGSAIAALELSDMVFGFGPYILFFILYRKNGKLQLGHLLLACFYFTLALKRIAVVAVLAPLVVMAVYFRLSDDGKRRFAAIVGYAGIAAVVVYMWSIKTGVLFQITDYFHIDTMSREYFYNRYNSFYELSPTFLGRGVRFIYRYEQSVLGDVRQAHNIFLQMFIEVGFWAWFAWLWYEIRFRISLVGKRMGFLAAAFLLAGTIYMWATFATDNTLYYWPPNVSFMHLSIFWAEAYRSAPRRKPGERLPPPVRKKGLLARVTF